MSTTLAPPARLPINGRTTPDLPDRAPPADRLFATPQQFDFFQAVRLLELMFPQRSQVGATASPEGETVHFSAAMGTSFPASSIAALEPADESGDVPTMTVAFLGLTGPSGALPAHYTDLLWRLQRDVRAPEKESLRAWYDLFNHRLTSLFYRAWEKYRPAIPYQRGDYRQASVDTFTQGLLSVAGLPTTAANARACEPSCLPRSLLRYAGLLAQRPRNVLNLKAILCDYFALPIDVLQFQGEWAPLACDQQMQLGVCGTLGSDATVGPRVWNRQGKVRIRIGPLERSAFEQLLPCQHDRQSGPHLGEIAAVTRLYLGPEVDFDLQLVLRAAEYRSTPLGEATGNRLGWNAWLPGDSSSDRDEAVFSLGV